MRATARTGLQTEKRSVKRVNIQELKRTEIVFVYDTTDANPNGDPNDEKSEVDPKGWTKIGRRLDGAAG
jgi:CRISPR/Cas system type I-B associated protein Csh2 (Cas7 group RAMP superfamily)